MVEVNEEVAGNYVTEEISLADLAGLDTSDIAVVSSRLPMAGLWTVLCTSLALSIQAPKEDGKQPLPKIAFKFESIKIDPTEKPEDFDPAKTAGRKLSDTTVLWPEDIRLEIGVLKGKYKRVGLPTDGVLGGVAGMEPGWLDGAVSHMMELRVRHAEIKGETRAFIDWVGPVEDADQEAA